jgi:putative resolvase
VPARQVSARTILIGQPQPAPGGVGRYARVSSHEQRADLDRQVARLGEWAANAGRNVAGVEAEVALGVNGTRPRLRRLLADPAIQAVVVTHRDRLARMDTELVEAALAAHGRRLVVLDDGEVADDLIRDLVEVLTSLCARRYGRRSARNRALKAVRCVERDVGPAGVAEAGAGGGGMVAG